MPTATKSDNRSTAGASTSLRALIELAPDIIALIDHDRIIKYISPAVERIAGFKPDELIGKRFDELLHPEDFESADRAFATMLGTRDVVTAQDRFRRKGGAWVTLETVARNYLDVPELEGILVCSRDVTRHVDLESTLRRSADECADLFEHAPCGYHSVDARGVFRRVNSTELSWLQRRREELVGQMRFADLLVPASQPAYWEAFALLKTAGAVRNAEFDVVRKDATTFPALLQSISVLSDQGLFLESRTTVYDITERKRAERALRKVNRALLVLSEVREQIIRARTESSLLEEICRVVVERGGYRLASVHFAQKDTGSTMRLVAKAGVDDGYLEAVNVTWADSERGRGPMGRAVCTGSPQVNQNFFTDPRMAPWRDLALRSGIHSAVSLPLKDQSGVFGTLSVHAAEADAFDPEELCLMEELADDVSFAVGSLLAQKFADEHAALKRGAIETPEKEPLAGLSPREREVLKLVAEGHSSKEIATMLRIAPASVDTYRSRLMFKLNVEDVTGLVRFAIRHGVIKP
jgi:PAS domain S-box-containing protein